MLRYWTYNCERDQKVPAPWSWDSWKGYTTTKQTDKTIWGGDEVSEGSETVRREAVRGVREGLIEEVTLLLGPKG